MEQCEPQKPISQLFGALKSLFIMQTLLIIVGHSEQLNKTHCLRNTFLWHHHFITLLHVISRTADFEFVWKRSYSFPAGHNMLLAHAKAWHSYDKDFRSSQNGRISVVVNSQWFVPKKKNTDDIQAADRGMQWFLGWMAHPVFVGDYPEVMKQRIKANSDAEGISCRYTWVICRLWQWLSLTYIITSPSPSLPSPSSAPAPSSLS